MMSADHSKEDLEFAIDKIDRIGKELELVK
jgi:hypothetical protein